MKSTEFFSRRMADAFPGQRGLEWYKDPQNAVERLSILLKDPLRFKKSSDEASDPVWWFRGSSNLFIERFTKLSKKKILIDINEFVIDEIAVYRGKRFEEDFIYVKTKAEKSIGLYEHFPEDIENEKRIRGYSTEEYALYKKKIPISRKEFDDGAALINKKPTDVKGSELRMRYLTDYNFIIAAKQSTINSPNADFTLDEIFNGILNKTHSFDQLFDFVRTLGARAYD